MSEQFHKSGTFFALYNLGFRPFFLGAGIFAMLSVFAWMVIYVFQVRWSTGTLPAYQWHAHEMVYGYSMAVMAGFLLTAVKNWTGIQTIHGRSLAILFVIWVVARIMFLPGIAWLQIATVLDLVFEICLLFAIIQPLIRSRNWKHLGIAAKVLFLIAGNFCFLLGLSGVLDEGINWGIYGGLYLVISLVLTIGSRVIPFFIERGVDYPIQLTNPVWLARLNLLFFIFFLISEVFLNNQLYSGIAATGLFFINTMRLYFWHTPGIWKKPLLWILYLSFVFINFGFLLFVLNIWLPIPKFIAIHALAYGGIGVITLGMMARISLGHTGRDIHDPPKSIIVAFIVIIAGSFIRVIFPFLNMQHYDVWIVLSQILWICAFLLFVISYSPILAGPRIDGKFG